MSISWYSRGRTLGTDKPEFILSSKEYFNELLDEVIKDLNQFEVHPFSKLYLSDLLNSFVHVDVLFEKNEEGKIESKMLCEKFFESQQLDSAERIQKLKKLAETTLYVSGFFASSLNKKLVSQSYYVQIGSMVYANLSHFFAKESKSDLYRHLSNHFVNYADLLTEVSHKVNIQKSNDVLEIFGRYIDTGSRWAEKHLVQNGVPLAPLKKTQN